MPNTTIALVTGANEGIGFAATRRLAEQGWTVLLGSRDRERGEAAIAELGGLDVRLVELDVTSEASVTHAAYQVDAEFGRLDVLVNNAGIVGEVVPAAELGAQEMRVTYETNVFGPVRMMRAFIPLLRRSPAPRVVMVSSGLGSIVITSGPAISSAVALGPPYALALPEFRINATDPGFTATDLNNHLGHQTVTEGSDAIVALAGIAPEGPTGSFFDRNGPVPW